MASYSTLQLDNADPTDAKLRNSNDTSQQRTKYKHTDEKKMVRFAHDAARCKIYRISSWQCGSRRVAHWCWSE